MNARGVIVEATASFAVTWQRVNGEIKWDQTAQKIELHSCEVYPDLEYTEASARATYVKYVSAARINDLIKIINARIDALLGAKDKTEDTGEGQPAEDNANQPQEAAPNQVNENESEKDSAFTGIIINS